MPNAGVWVEGFSSRDPIIKYTKKNEEYAILSVAAAMGFEDKKRTEWFNIFVFKKWVLRQAKAIRKGDFVRVEGEPQAHNYQNKAGATIPVIQIVADKVFIINLQKNDALPPHTGETLPPPGAEVPDIPDGPDGARF